jgi:hypothetical protein
MQQPDNDFTRAEAAFLRLRAQLDARQISLERFNQALDGMMVLFQNRYWQLGANSGRWYVHDGQTWSEATPPVAGVGVAAQQMAASGASYASPAAPASPPPSAAAPAPQRRFCSDCGTALAPPGGFCSHCGRRFE